MTDDELDALVRRLREHNCIGYNKCQDSADAIDALRERVRELESVPVAEDVEAIARDLEAWPRPWQGPDPSAAASLLRSLSRQIAAKDAEIARLGRDLRTAEITLRDRQHSTKETRDSAETMRTLGFWPDCGCGECYAIHCLDEQMTRAEKAEAEEAALAQEIDRLFAANAALRLAVKDDATWAQENASLRETLAQHESLWREQDARQTAEIEAMRADAERYSWMRDEFRNGNWYAKFFLLNGARFDAAIDAARREVKP